MLYAHQITDEHKTQYIELIYNGLKPHTAARELGSTGHQFRKHRRPQSRYFDPVFAEEYEVAIQSQDHKDAFLEHLEDIAMERAQRSDKILLSYLYAYHPDFAPLRHPNLNVSISGEVAHRLLPHMPREQIEQALEKEKAELAHLKALPAPKDEVA